ncbi:M48 family metallopeptidase [Sphingomicrobium astaxanthinifaciens]|uniref:M48 family metallopeptidase n=1 Tax=Sphingomicrobium astaxanthinifaciens TaxID=1227949 RepID=UPI001FCBFA67|nr:YgjP-like metallopeptidase domain-containing protein [Sphingomicrobium astaxanthinifaciens]MCJ7421160.1 M48 family metallopeptidase [Sphingomicrobium astaxanthinifaciens]
MRSEPLIASLEPPIAVDLVRHARARRFSLRYDAVRDRVRLVLPKRGSARAALAWAEGEAAWIARQRAARPEARPFEPGASIPFRGATLRLVYDPAAPRRPVLDDGALRIGGPAAGFARRVEGFLRDEARRLLAADVAAYAAAAGVDVRAVSVGDAKGRWGSCSARGDLRFSWRLVLVPDPLRRYVAAHEVAHRLHMDHSPAFRAAEAALYEGDPQRARAALRALAPGLRLVGA